MLPDAIVAIERTLDRFRNLFERFPAEIESFANFPSLFLGLTDGAGKLEHYDGPLAVANAEGTLLCAGIPAERYSEYIGEQTEDDSYMKSAYYKPLGYPDGMYRVGPLPRLNLVDSCGTPKADGELEALRKVGGRILRSSFYYHHARLVEMLYSVERIAELLAAPDILDTHVRAFAQPNAEEGIGIAEAPRGTLIHHYKVDKNGLIRWANLIIATGNNNLAMNRGVKQVAVSVIRDGRLNDGALNRIEAVIRAFDPCLSCSTHALGQMALAVETFDHTGKSIERMVRPA
jgi:NAD-reducing hydrogenase large subunit